MLLLLDAKPTASAVTEYSPEFTSEKLYRPSWPVLTERLIPVAVAVSITLAPGTAAPDGSVSTPLTEPACWAGRDPARNNPSSAVLRLDLRRISDLQCRDSR